jgi:metallo-beta-lactamase class B
MRNVAAVVLAALITLTVIAAQSVPNTVEGHVAAARAAAGSDYGGIVERLCSAPTPPAPRNVTAAAPRPPGPPARETWYAKPTKVFDNLYFVGMTEYSSWALTTSAGIIIIDPIFDYSVEEEVVKGLKSLNLDPTQIKYVLVSHGHSDHVGGASFLQDTFKAKVIMSDADWTLVENTKAAWRKPKRDMIATDGQKLTLGDTTITLYITPGHTLGTISSLIPVRDGNQRHMAAYWGGTAFNWLSGGAAYITPDRPNSFWFNHYIESAERFRKAARDAGADVILSNHTVFDGSKTKLPALATRRPQDPHPYVVGADSVSRYLTVAEECAKAGLLRAK